MKQDQRIDHEIALAEKLKQAAEDAAAQYERFKKKVLVPLAKRYGVRAGDSWRLTGAKHAAVITARHELELTPRGIAYVAGLQRTLARYVSAVVTYKPLPELYRLWHDRRAWPRADVIVRRLLRTGLSARRSWSIRLDLKK